MTGVLGGENREEGAERLLEEMLAETSQVFMINNLPKISVNSKRSVPK